MGVAILDIETHWMLVADEHVQTDHQQAEYAWCCSFLIFSSTLLSLLGPLSTIRMAILLPLSLSVGRSTPHSLLWSHKQIHFSYRTAHRTTKELFLEGQSAGTTKKHHWLFPTTIRAQEPTQSALFFILFFCCSLGMNTKSAQKKTAKKVGKKGKPFVSILLTYAILRGRKQKTGHEARVEVLFLERVYRGWGGDRLCVLCGFFSDFFFVLGLWSNLSGVIIVPTLFSSL